MYQALYRKWRPKTFDDVAGQEHITRTLKNEFRLGRVSHAYLFTGSRGTGKTTCAKILAKAVNCLNPQDGNPCCECEICRAIDSESITDVVEMDAASNRGIEDIRDIIDTVQFSPTRAKYRVYIVDEVHMLSKDAFNALLKTLEEPPKHVVFVLATTEVHKVLPTIRSRCQQFDFHRIPVRAISDRLLYVANQEQLTLDESSADLIASIADGALRDALSLLDRCVSISKNIDEEVVRAAAGLADRDYLYDLASCVINRNTAGALGLIDRLYGEAKDMPRLCSELIAHFRGLMIIKTVSNPREMIVFTDDEFERAVTQADYLALSEIIYYMDVLSRAAVRMGKGTSDRTELEMALVKLTSPELDVTSEALFARISALEKAVKKGAALGARQPLPITSAENEAQQTRQAAQAEQPEQAQAQTETAGELPLPDDNEETQPQASNEPESQKPEKTDSPPQEKPAEDAAAAQVPKRPRTAQDSPDIVALSRAAKPFPQWTEVVENIKGVTRSTAAAFAGSTAYINGGFLLIDAGNTMAFDLLKVGENRKAIRDGLLEVTGKSYRLGPYRLQDEAQAAEDPLDAFKAKLRDSGIQINEE